ncbi:MAG: permease-like cell division protein FtsX [Bacteroidales bacterium]|jgi:cell division transport system permease protein|nr:permease-like cell division protein FtsX [Bacteroidales bacterium]
MSAGENKLIKRRLAGAWISSVISITLVLFLVGVASLLLVNAKSVSDYFKENVQVSVLMKQDVSEDDAMDFASSLDSRPFIKGTRFVSKAEGTREMADMLGEDFLNVFETAPIPISIDVNLKAEYVSPDSLEVVKKEIAGSPLVEEVVYQQSLVDKLNTNLAKISLVLGVFVALLLFISFVLINNTVRLNVFSKRFTIHTMKLVGATKSFIRGPFLGQSVFQGLFSALLAILMLLAGLFIVRREFSQLFEVFSLDLLLVVLGIVVVSGVVICLVSTYFVVGKLVSLPKDDLYY